MRAPHTIRLWLVLLVLLGPTVCRAVAHDAAGDRTLRVGDSDVWEFNGMTTAATGDPAVADIVPLSTRRLLVNARGPGRTTILVFDRRGRHATRLTVAAPVGEESIAAQVRADIGLPSVTARAVRDTLFLEGTVPTPEASRRAEAIAGVYTAKVRNLLQVTPNPSQKSLAETYAALINEIWAGQGVTARVMDPQTIALTGAYTPPAEGGAPPPEPAETDALVGTSMGDAAPAPQGRSRRRAAPASTSGSLDSSAADLSLQDRTPGILQSAGQNPLDRMLTTLPAGLEVVNMVQVGDRPVQQILVRAKIIDINRDSTKQLGVSWGSLSPNSFAGHQYAVQPQPILFGQLPGDQFRDVLGGGRFVRYLPFAAALNALITDNKARILSEPSLLVRDGAEGNLLVGGEIPIPVAQTNSGYAGATVSVEYKPFGVRLYVAPRIVAPGTIELTATPEVSDLDYGNGVSFNGLSIPALTISRATSTLQLHDGETLVIGGLYANTTQRQVQRIPLLSQVPVLGEFFKNTVTRKRESELLVLLSVQIVGPDSPDTRPPAPGSTENLPIGRPDVPRHAFDTDFPDLDHLGRPDRDQPKVPVNLPPVPALGGRP